MKHWSDSIPKSACLEAAEWCKTQRSFASAWKNCKRGDWMLWILGRQATEPESASRKRLVLCACALARTALKHVPAGEARPRLAIETAEKWARGEATIKQVRTAAWDAGYYAARAARAASWAASVASYDASCAASHAASSAAGDASAASVAWDAGYYAARAASVASYDASYAARAASSAKIVRKFYPRPPKLTAPTKTGGRT